MKIERGITLISVTLTVIIMIFLGVLLVKASVDSSLLKQLNTIKQDSSSKIENTNKKTQSIEDAWNGVI